MDDEKKALLAERKRLANECLDHAKAAIADGMMNAAVRGIEMAKRQIEYWPTEF